MVKADAAERFLSTPLLDDLDRESRQAILEIVTEVRVKAGTVLLKQGEANGLLSFLIEGSVNVERPGPHGRPETLASLTAPAVFGTTSFFRPTLPTVTIRAATDVCVLTIDHSAHEALRHDKPRAAEALALAALRVLCDRFDLLDKRITELMSNHPDGSPKVTEWSNFRARLFEEAGS